MPGRSRIGLTTICMILFALIISCDSGSSSSKIKITPSNSYDFGQVALSSSATKDFIFSNNTSVSINISSISITGTHAPQYAVTVGGAATSVPASDVHTITVQFTPTGGIATAVLRVKYIDDSGSPKEFSVNLKGSSVDEAVFNIDVSGTPPTYDYGAVASGNTKSHIFTITNTGTANLTISSITLSVNVFTITAGFTPGTPEVVTSGNQLKIYVQFAPSTVGPVNGTMSIEHSAKNVSSPFVVNLTGAGGSRTFETDVPGTPPTLDFGSVFSGVTNTRKTITITNTGFNDLEITNISFSSNVFSVVSGWTGATIQIGPVPAKHEIVIQFAPTAVTNYNETITFAHNGVNVTSPTDINLKGVGTNNYNAEQFTLGYTPLSSTNFVILSKNDYKQVSIGFTFKYYGNNYTSAWVSSKGYIGFGPNTGYDTFPTNTTVPSSNTPNNIIMLFTGDFDPSQGAIIRYDVEGTAPDRAFIIHISGLEDDDSNTTEIVSGQIRLYESSNIIELCYPTNGITWPTASNPYDVLIGLENENGTLGVNYNGIDPNPVTATPTWNIRYK